jgi:hypothetical protein
MGPCCAASGIRLPSDGGLAEVWVELEARSPAEALQMVASAVEIIGVTFGGGADFGWCAGPRERGSQGTRRAAGEAQEGSRALRGCPDK